MSIEYLISEAKRWRNAPIAFPASAVDVLALADRLAAAERDAARYRWLREANRLDAQAVFWNASQGRKNLDTAIDAAIAADRENESE